MNRDSLITISVKSPKDKKEITIKGSGNIKEVKEICAREFSTTANQLCVIFSGKILNDVDVLLDVGVRDGSSLHLVVKSAHRMVEESTERVEPRVLQSVSQADVSASPFGLGALGGLSGLNGLGMGSANFMDLQQRMMQEMVSNPELLKSLLDSPFVQHMMSSPETMRTLMETNPQLREVMERNPEIIQTMGDPELMKRMIEVVQSPAMLQELMRGQEHLVGVTRGVSSSAESGDSSTKPGQSTSHVTTAPTTINDLFGDASSRSLLQQVIQTPQLMTNMLQAPYVQSMLQAMSKNPQLVEQMITNSHLFANNPVLQSCVPQALPYFAEQLQNPEIQNLMSNQRALQAMLLIQQGMQELHAEIPSVFGLSGSNGSGDSNAYTQYMQQMLQMVYKNPDDQPSVQKYALQLQQLSLMGFTNSEANNEVLTATQGDLNAAVNRLIQQR